MALETNENKTPGGGKTHRAFELVETLKRLGGSARTSHLADTMNVSEETIRRTVKKLSKDGIVSRVHGGVYLAKEHSASKFHRRIGEHPEAKRRIGTHLATLVEDGASLFMDVGSTTIFAAEALRAKKRLTVVTNSLSIAQTLMNHNHNRVFLAGGELQNALGGTFGSATQKFVAKFRADIAVLSAEAIDGDQGFLLREQNEAELAQTYIEHARKSYMVADHSKINRSAPMVSCDPNDIDRLIIDEPPPSDVREAMKRWGVEIVVAPKKAAQVKKKKHK